MGTEHKRSGPKENNMEEIPVPPGFVSLTSFTLKRIDNTEQTHCSKAVGDELEIETRQLDASAHIVDIGKLKRSLRHRPWILPSRLGYFPVESDSPFDVNVPLRAHFPKGVIRGCSSCDNCQKVMASWHLEESCIPVLEEVPVFHPTEEEFKDAIKYVTSIRSKAEMYGICRIVPPASWQPPCLLKEKTTWASSKFNTCVERINELQNLCLASEYCRVHGKVKCKRRKVLKDSESESCEGPTTDAGEDEPDAESFKSESGPLFTLETFKKYADDFQRQYFGKKDEVADSSSIATVFTELEGPSVVDVEGEYWRVIETPTEEIEVLSAVGVDTRSIGSGFPVKSNLIEGLKYHEYTNSAWNLNNIPTLSGSLLSFENRGTSATLFPRLSIGMCFSSFCWNVEEHHLYSLCYSHAGASRVWYCIPGSYHSKFEEVVRKQYPQLSEHPELLHKLVIQISPSLIPDGVPVYRCVQYPREFVLVLPGAYHSVFNCGFNCSEAANFATLDWLPHGQNITELYSEQRRKTSISHDKILLRAAMKAVRAQLELSLMKNKSSDDEQWSSARGKDSVLVKTFKLRIEQESRRREYLCSSSLSRKMEDDFDATTKRECCVCHYDLHLSAAGCSCSPDKYTCLRHAKQLCSCPWTARYFLFRYEINELNILAEALEGKSTAIYRWTREKLGRTLSSSLSKDAGNHLRHGVELSSTNPVKQRASNFTNLTMSSGVPKEPAFTVETVIKGSMLQGECFRKEEERAKRSTPTVGTSNSVFELDLISALENENGATDDRSQLMKDTVLISNANPHAHQTKQVPVEKLSHSGKNTVICSNPTRDDTSTRNAAEKSSRDQIIVILSDDDDDE